MREAVVVIGGGPAGGLTALAVRHRTGRPVVIVDPAPRLGPGTAYATDDPRHLLNSRAGAMSADPAAPDDFVAWCRAHGPAVTADDFVPRGLYGRYLTDRLDEEAAGLRHRPVRATRIRPDRAGWTVVLADGGTIPARDVVLAVGHADPTFPGGADPALIRCPSYVATPWAAGALDEVAPDARVLLLGTGLSAVDVALTLDGRGHTGPITAVSRHGLLPCPHPAAPATAAVPPITDATSVRAVTRAARAAAAAGHPWPAVVDQLRRQADDIWAQWTATERRRFLRHVARFWEVHRHRTAPEVTRTVARMRERGTLRCRAARVVAIRPSGGRCAVTLVAGGVTEQHDVDAVVNCTGPGHPAGIPLVRALAADGLVRPDPDHVGVDVGRDGQLVGRDGRATGIHVVGSLRRGQWWETTAVPEIRTQAHAVAAAM